MNKQAKNRPRIHAFTYVIIAAMITIGHLAVAGGPSVTVTWNPADAQDWGVDYYVTGTLTNAASSIGDNEAGYYQTLGTLPGFNFTFTKVPCCDDKGVKGFKLKVKLTDIKIDAITIQGYYRLVVWSDRESYVNSRPSAVAEWDRVFNDTRNHEKRHHSQTQQYLNQDSIQNFIDEQFVTDITSNCDTDPDGKNTIAEIKATIRSKIKLAIENAIKNADQKDNTHIVWPYTIIDTKKDK